MCIIATMRGHLIDARRRRGMTQTALAVLLGVLPNTISRAEAGLNLPRGDAWVRLCKALAIDPERALEQTASTTTRPPRPRKAARPTVAA